MLQTRKIQLAIFAILVVTLAVIGYWHVFIHAAHSGIVAANTSQLGPDDTQVDNQGDATAIVIYKTKQSADHAVFDIDITTHSQDLTQYNYKTNLVLTDADINPLPYQSIKPTLVSKNELKVQFTSQKFKGSHFHFDVRNLGGIDDRVLHFYHSI